MKTKRSDYEKELGMVKGIKGYKAFNANMTCRDMQYEIGKIYEMDEKPIICKRGFHFCKTVTDCYNFYECSDDNTIVCEILAIGDIVSDESCIKFCTNRIKIVKKLRNPRSKSNVDSTSTGFCNSGSFNTGDYNSGDYNTGCENFGDFNTGKCNFGSSNTGNLNIGYRNSGFYNTGNRNTGIRNTGDYNTGNNNLGNFNTGDFNIGSYSCGVFCTENNPTIKLFDKESDMTLRDWKNSRAQVIMCTMPVEKCYFIEALNMTDEEKRKHPEYKFNKGYVKRDNISDSDRQQWWDRLTKEDKETILALPNFNAKKFMKCTGINVNKNEEDNKDKEEI